MATAAPPPKGSASPPPASKAPPSPANQGAAKSFNFAPSSGRDVAAHRVVIYGTGGIGKTELASNLAAVGIKPLILDLEDGSRFLDVTRLKINSFDELRAALQNPGCADFGAIVVDSFTKAEEYAAAWVLANIKKDGAFVPNIKAYGWGDGYAHIYDAFLRMLGDLDSHIRAGRHVVCIAHDNMNENPNSTGFDWFRMEPRLQTSKKGDNSIRLRVKEWCDHMLYIGYDVAVDKEGKAMGSGSRTIYCRETPAMVAKSKELCDPIPYLQGDTTLWEQMFGIERK